ncbi:MAG: acetyl-mannosamine transferase [Spirosoma sp.]|nr:acetyl-mannosamine transferase [Spirosoma sp.]
MEKVKVGKAYVSNVTQREAVDYVDKVIANHEKGYVVTPNLDHIVKLEEDPEFVYCYENAALVLADGNPVVWASRFLGTPLKELVTGSDLFQVLCQHAAERGHTLFFLGGLEGVAQKAADELKKQYPQIKVVGVYSPPFGFEKNQDENLRIIEMINAVKPNILFVGVGAPKQEKWMYKNIGQLDVNVALGIGASFDFVAGTVKRAPKLFRQMGMEWFWRVSNEPRRLFKRYFIDSARFVPIIYNQKNNK